MESKVKKTCSDYDLAILRSYWYIPVYTKYNLVYLPGVLLRERLEGAGGISSVKTHKRKFKATVSIPDVIKPVELS